MSIVNREALKQLGCVLHWPGQSAVSGAYDDDGNKRGFPILPDGVTVTPSGIFTTQKMKDGRNIWKFDGSTNYITFTNNSNFSFVSGDFTICCWVIIPTFKDANILSKYTTWATDIDYILYFRNASTSIRFLAGASVPIVLDSGTVSAGVWYHITIVRIGTIYTMYLNCVPISTVTNATTLTNNAALRFGAENTAGQYNNGNLKDLMIFRGKALSVDQIAAIMKETYIY